MHLLDSHASHVSQPGTLYPSRGLNQVAYELPRKSYYAAQLDLEDAAGHTQNPGLQRLRSKRGGARNQPEKPLP